MSHDASELLGENQVAGASVKPIGSASRQATIVGPAVGGGLAAGITRVPRSQVASAEMTGVWFVHLVVNFADGTRWAFEVSPQNKRQARTVVGLFGANG